MEIKHIKKWEPINNIPAQLFLEGLYDTYDGFKINLKGKLDTDPILILQFSSYLAYQNTEETCRLKSLQTNEILSTEWPLFISNNSSYIDWLIEESYKIVDSRELLHYIITCSDCIIDIISDEAPTARWL